MTLEEIRYQMIILDENKEILSDGEYLLKANKLRDLFLEVQNISSQDDNLFDEFEDIYNASIDYLYLNNYFSGNWSPIEINFNN